MNERVQRPASKPALYLASSRTWTKTRVHPFRASARARTHVHVITYIFIYMYIYIYNKMAKMFLRFLPRADGDTIPLPPVIFLSHRFHSVYSLVSRYLAIEDVRTCRKIYLVFNEGLNSTKRFSIADHPGPPSRRPPPPLVVPPAII